MKRDCSQAEAVSFPVSRHGLEAMPSSQLFDPGLRITAASDLGKTRGISPEIRQLVARSVSRDKQGTSTKVGQRGPMSYQSFAGFLLRAMIDPQNTDYPYLTKLLTLLVRAIFFQACVKRPTCPNSLRTVVAVGRLQ